MSTTTPGRTPLHHAAEAGDIASLKAILAQDTHHPDDWDTAGNTALMLACEAGHKEAAELLLHAGANADWRRADGQTALHLAAAAGQKDLVSLLLIAPGGGYQALNPAARSNRGEDYPLNIAAARGHELITSLLLAAGASAQGRRDDATTPLMEAAMRGQQATADMLLRAGAELERTDPQGGTALFLAAQEGQADMVRLLAKKGSDIHHADEDGMTALHAAALFTTDHSATMAIASADFDALPPHENFLAEKGERSSTVKTLLSLGAKPNVWDANGRTPLHYATLRGDEEAANALLAAGAEPDAISPEDGTTPLMAAAANGHRHLFEKLLALGANPQLYRADGRSLLHAAARGGDPGIIRCLLELGLSPDAEDEETRTVLHVAAGNCPLECFELLLAHSNSGDLERPNAAGPRTKGGRTLLHQAACNEQPDTLRYLLERGANPLAQDAHGDQPLNLAASRTPEHVRLLLAAGADANHPGYGGRPPLHAAVYAESSENIRLLLAAGARVNEQEPDTAYTALHIAALCHAEEAAQALLAAGADISLRDSEGDTPLHAAAFSGKPSIIHCLLAHGANVNATDNEGRTPLIRALVQEEAEAVATLLKAGADPNAPDAAGRTPLHLALEEEAGVPCLLALHAAGANLNTPHPATGETALLMAFRLGDRPAAIALLALGADAAPADNKGMTALHLAVKENATGFIRPLLHAGGSPFARNKAGKTPLDLARTQKMRALLGGLSLP